MRSLQKSTHEAVCESRSTKHAILSVLHKELNYRPWNSHYVQKLKPADCDRKMGWHGVFLMISVTKLLVHKEIPDLHDTICQVSG